MKSYTDIEQSKRLAEILPIESADCFYLAIKENNEVIQTPGFLNINALQKEKMFAEKVSVIPCWTLAALLEVMPIELEVGLFKTPISGEYLFSWWTDDYHMGDDYKEPIDAAYEMVHWLLENGYIKTKEK